MSIATALSRAPLSFRFHLKDDLPSLVARAQIPKPFHSKSVIQETLHPRTLFPLARIYKGRQ
jgi:hypothetical protein